MYAFSGLRWWPALLLRGAAALVDGRSRRTPCFERRDIGSGVLAARPGPARASRSLGSPVGLAWRLQRGAVLGWALGLAFTGLAYGSIGDDAGDLLGDNPSRGADAAAGRRRPRRRLLRRCRW